ncbi:HAMP domain-containing histidine kinase [Cellulomonas sp. JH27-2]|uniref:HAMP domain-containing sensor histidine kinase n=1 Tax=Cellulomonas sp. JH27-2 TaxID=2774139 RepID=UPI0017853C8A|nr:HAMP domain-containing sensor histidine kinase [Cellulomonas sp. JH27-2]MBD8058870.1 HAMP domain-containing histidine kinase [Cellulomonas sp. JH27-2]
MKGTPWRAWGVRRRIVVTTAASTLVGMAVLVALTALVLDRTVDNNVRSLLADRADAVASAVVTEDGTLRTSAAGEPSDEVAWVFDATGTQVHGPSGSPLDDEAHTLGTVNQATTRETDDWILLADPLPAGAGTVVVGASLDPYESTRDAALLASAVVGVLVVAAVTTMTAWTVTRALRPVASMARSAAAWSERDLDRRFELGPPHDEITELGEVLDRLLARVSRALLAEQRLTAELAHELRTPLTVVRAEAELGATEPGVSAATRERLDRIVAATDHLTGVVDSLLSAARGAASGDVRTPVNDVIQLAVRGPALPASSVAIVVETAPELLVATPADVALRALTPLLVNALEHGRDRVLVRPQARGEWVAIDVEDDGDGVPADLVDAVFTPGVRSEGSAGAGLGLPLARRIARASGGDVVLDPDDRARFVLTLPRA